MIRYPAGRTKRPAAEQETQRAMSRNRQRFAQRLFSCGWIVLGVGVALVLVRLVMELAFAAGIIIIAGLVMLLVGRILLRR